MATVAKGQWTAATRCTDWNVHDLVNHIVVEELWLVPLVHGSTIAEVGNRFEGDILGEDPIETSRHAAAEATNAVEEVPSGTRVHLSYGDEDLEEYLRQLAVDHLVHGWDLAVATGGDSQLDQELAEVAGWFAEREDLYPWRGQDRASSWEPVTRKPIFSPRSDATPAGPLRPDRSARDSGPRHATPEGLDHPAGTGHYVWMSECKTPSIDVDPMITEAVENISNHFGSQGLCDLIALAHEELARAEEALRELSDAE